MNNKGFISTALVITTIILAAAIILLLINKVETNSNFSSAIATNVKTKLVNAKSPHCFWGSAPYMTLFQGVATSSILVSCFHIDGINSAIEELNIENLTSYFEISNPAKISVTKVLVIPKTNGYNILLELSSVNAGKYTLKLKKNTIETNDGYYNLERISKFIVVE